mgnify:FL=1|jgi:hypothetical protein
MPLGNEYQGLFSLAGQIKADKIHIGLTWPQ